MFCRDAERGTALAKGSIVEGYIELVIGSVQQRTDDLERLLYGLDKISRQQ